jgi:hypothetical protein
MTVPLALALLHFLVISAEEGGSAMIDHEVGKIVDKLQKLRALRRARERVRQLERELHGEPAKSQGPAHLPEFLRQHAPLRVAK